jgi:NAD(P)H dehydrogenase (quinone)
MKVVITGASGNYGRAAVEGLLERVPAADLIATTRSPARLAHFEQRGVAVRAADFDDPASLVDAFSGAEKMLLISTGRVGKRIPQHRNAIDAAVAAGVRHIVYTSSVGVGTASPALVVKEHSATEDMLRASGLQWTALRDNQYADAMAEVAAPLAIANGRWIASAGEGQIGFVTRQDCVAAAVAVLATSGHGNTVYQITGPDLLSFRDVATLATEVSGRKIDYIVVDDAGLYGMFDELGIPREAVDDQLVGNFPWSSNDMVSYEQAIRGGYMAVVSHDVARLTGREPQSLRDFFLQRASALRGVV